MTSCPRRNRPGSHCRCSRRRQRGRSHVGNRFALQSFEAGAEFARIRCQTVGVAVHRRIRSVISHVSRCPFGVAILIRLATVGNAVRVQSAAPLATGYRHAVPAAPKATSQSIGRFSFRGESSSTAEVDKHLVAVNVAQTPDSLHRRRNPRAYRPSRLTSASQMTVKLRTHLLV